MASVTWLTELPGSPLWVGTRQEARGVDWSLAGCDPDAVGTHKEIHMDAEHGLSVAVTRPPTLCHWQKAQPVTANRRKQEEGCGHRTTTFPDRPCPPGCSPPLSSPALTALAGAAMLHNGRGRHSRGILRAYLGWFPSVSACEFVSPPRLDSPWWAGTCL